MRRFNHFITIKPNITITPPNQSSLSSLNLGVTGSFSQQTIIEITPIKKLMKKHHDQFTYYTKTPPITGPRLVATENAMEFNAIDFATSFYATKMPHKDIELDIKNAAKTP